MNMNPVRNARYTAMLTIKNINIANIKVSEKLTETQGVSCF